MPSKNDPCEHLERARPGVQPRTTSCEGCAALGERSWNQLRVCLTCGHVGCCEDSRHAHALAHFHETGHPLIASLETGDTWGWCYVDRRYIDPMPFPLPRPRSRIRSLLDRILR